MFDTCNCERSEDCMCAALSSYVRACAAEKVELPGWRTNVCCKSSKQPSRVLKWNNFLCQWILAFSLSCWVLLVMVWSNRLQDTSPPQKKIIIIQFLKIKIKKMDLVMDIHALILSMLGFSNALYVEMPSKSIWELQISQCSSHTTIWDECIEHITNTTLISLVICFWSQFQVLVLTIKFIVWDLDT